MHINKLRNTSYIFKYILFSHNTNIKKCINIISNEKYYHRVIAVSSE